MLGLRWAEVAGLSVRSLDLLRNTVTVSWQLGRDRQLAEMPDELSAALAAHLAVNHLTGANADRMLFTTHQGAPLDYSHWRERVWLPAVARAGIPAATFHDLRRANATTLVTEGVNVKTAQTRLGHAEGRPRAARRRSSLLRGAVSPLLSQPVIRGCGPARQTLGEPTRRRQAVHESCRPEPRREA